MKVFLLMAFAFFTSRAAFAQNTLPPLITVTGEATVNVAPDEAILNFGVQSMKPTADEAKKELDAKIQKILSYVKTQGIEQKHFQTSFLNLYYNTYGEVEGRRRDEYVATQTITMTLKNMAGYEKLISGLINVGVNRIDGLFFQTSEMTKYREQARTLAIQSARQKAEKMAKDLGQTIGTAYMIEEEPGSSPMYREGNGARNMMREASTDVAMSEGDPTIATGQIPVRSRVRVSFYLLNK